MSLVNINRKTTPKANSFFDSTAEILAMFHYRPSYFKTSLVMPGFVKLPNKAIPRTVEVEHDGEEGDKCRSDPDQPKQHRN